jgi:glycosyltransferase involved in cell wall biosynthesis
MVFPVIEEFGGRECTVLCASSAMLHQVPPGVPAVSWPEVLRYDVAGWRSGYKEYWRECKVRLRDTVNRFHLPNGAYERLADALMTNTQMVAGAMEWLRRSRPKAILTESDRMVTWSCLVLAAKVLGIRTYTLVHGVFGDESFGFAPVLADKVFCWGEMDRARFIRAGEPPEKAVIAGCPRLTREIPVSPAEARRKVGLDPDKPVVMLGTSPFAPKDCLQLAETFCKAVDGATDFSAAVRLHPSETVEAYAEVAGRYPSVRFLPSSEWTLDESLAASDIVVVNDSGLGGDALVKRRLTVVLDVFGRPLGYSGELVEKAQCPRARSAEELHAAIWRLLRNPQERARQVELSERYVAQFCAAYGRDAAKRIADQIRSEIIYPGRGESVSQQ